MTILVRRQQAMRHRLPFEHRPHVLLVLHIHGSEVGVSRERLSLLQVRQRLVVYVLHDELARAVKRAPILSQADGIAVVAACRHVDAVVASGPRVLTPAYMRERGYDLYALGYADEREAQAKLRTCSELPPDMRVVIPDAEGISSTQIRARILQAGEPGDTPA